MSGRWLVKQEPETYAFETFRREKRTPWDGVRNHQARGHLAAMEVGDDVLYYHSGKGREVVGLARVVRAAYPDPTADDPRWVAVDLEAVAPLARPVALADIKAEPRLAELALVRQSRLSVMPVDDDAFDLIVAMGGGVAG